MGTSTVRSNSGIALPVVLLKEAFVFELPFPLSPDKPVVAIRSGLQPLPTEETGSFSVGFFVRLRKHFTCLMINLCF